LSSVDVDAARVEAAAAASLSAPSPQLGGRIAQGAAAAAAAAGADSGGAAEGGRRNGASAASPAAAAARAKSLERSAGPGAAFDDDDVPTRLRSSAEEKEDARGAGGNGGSNGSGGGGGGLCAPPPLLLRRRAAPAHDAASAAAASSSFSGASSAPLLPDDANGNGSSSSSNGSSSMSSSSSSSSSNAPAEAAAAPAPAPAPPPAPPPPAPAPIAAAAAAAAPTKSPPRLWAVAGVPPPVVVLSLVSMALTGASCVFNTLLPIYMVAELKMPMASMGAFEGLLEAFSYAVRMASGVLSDRLGSRKAAIAAGFCLGAASKLGLSFASALPQLFVGKALDRLANGVQAAPRDALIGDLSPAASRSACYGFAQSMRKWGSFVGAGLAFFLMKATGGDYRAIFLGATGVTVLATAAFCALVPGGGGGQARAAREQQAPPQAAAAAAALAPPAPAPRPASRLLDDVRQMSGDFWRTLAVICMYGAGHVNESLLEARAMEVGFPEAEAALVVAALCFAVFLTAYPLGRLGDARGHRVTFSVGMAALIAGDLCLVASSSSVPWAVFAAALLWGAHVAVLQGPMLAVVVGLAPPHLKGTAFGIFYSAMAAVAVAANSAYGLVWQAYGAPACYGLSAAVVTLALCVGAPLLLPRSRAMDGPGWRAGRGEGGKGEGGGGEGRPAAA